MSGDGRNSDFGGARERLSPQKLPIWPNGGFLSPEAGQLHGTLRAGNEVLIMQSYLID